MATKNTTHKWFLSSKRTACGLKKRPSHTTFIWGDVDCADCRENYSEPTKKEFDAIIKLASTEIKSGKDKSGLNP